MMQTQTASIFVPMLLGHRFKVPVGVVRQHKLPDVDIQKRNKACKSYTTEALTASVLLNGDGIPISTIHAGVTNGSCQRTVRMVVNRWAMLKYVSYSAVQNRFGRGRKERDVFVIDREALEKIARRLEK